MDSITDVSAYFNHLLLAVAAGSDLFEKKNAFFSNIKLQKHVPFRGEGGEGCSVLNVLNLEKFQTARFLSYVWSFSKIMNKMVKHNETNTCTRELLILSLLG